MREADGSPNIAIARQLRGYKDSDPGINHQACIPLEVFKAIYNCTTSHFDISIGQLISGALFFACRSCEYTDAGLAEDEKRKTKVLRLKDLRFIKNNRTINSNYETADSVAITFRFQKNGEKNYTITQHKTGTEFCPVRAWGGLKKRILSYPGTSENSKVSLVKHGRRVYEITAAQVKQQLKIFVASAGAERLGIDLDRIGTHSIRTSCAMFLHLAGVQVYFIMLIGRWKSDAFLLYLRQQVNEFTEGVSKAMVSSHTGNSFFTVPSVVARDPMDPCNRMGGGRLTPHTRVNGGVANRQNSEIDPFNPPAFYTWR